MLLEDGVYRKNVIYLSDRIRTLVFMKMRIESERNFGIGWIMVVMQVTGYIILLFCTQKGVRVCVCVWFYQWDTSDICLAWGVPVDDRLAWKLCMK